MRIRQNRKRADKITRGVVLFLPLAALCVVGLVAAVSLSAGSGAAANLNPVERVLLSVYLGWRKNDLTQPAGSDATPVTFTVAPGETAAVVAERLAAQHLVSDAQLLNYYLRYKGYDQRIEAGDFALRQTMTLTEVAQALTDASARQVSIRLFEGWRLEQMAASLSANPALAVSETDFMALAGAGHPHAGEYAFLSTLPAGASLEGFLYPDTYLVRPGASAGDVIDKMLANFQAHLPADYQPALAARHLNVYQAVTIASLIEREAVVDDERPVIAAVILNRLAIGQPLEIDATVQYALGTPENWWPLVAGLDFHTIVSPYNTYYVAGLPAGPIASPRLSSLLAVAHPAQVNYLYYRAKCDGSGRHAFAATYQEQLANACP
jgi:UPF0755 protein